MDERVEDFPDCPRCHLVVRPAKLEAHLDDHARTDGLLTMLGNKAWGQEINPVQAPAHASLDT